MDENVKTTDERVKRIVETKHRLEILAEARKDPVLNNAIDWDLIETQGYADNTLYFKDVIKRDYITRVENLGRNIELKVSIDTIEWNWLDDSLCIHYTFEDPVKVIFHIVK
jgi:hypothetical protein